MTAPILYIEDEEDYQLLVKRILKRIPVEVETVDTGEAGFLALHRAPPRLIILDVNLPDTDGFTLCQQLRRNPAWMDLPVLMLTVRRRHEEWLRGFSSGATDYISKPINPDELIERVRHCLARCGPRVVRHSRAEYHLIQAAAAGNRSAFEVLIEKYFRRLRERLRFILQNEATADDVASEAFVTAFENLRYFRGDSSFYTWVYRIALNDSINGHRNLGQLESLENLLDAEDRRLYTNVNAQKPIDTVLTDRAASHRAMDALKKVPEPYRKMLNLFVVQDLSYETIGKKLRIPPGTVMSRLHKGRKLLQEAWIRTVVPKLS